ncbi:MAG TPA: carbamoyltransferase HypF [Mariprofundaceae bacterium]|nr:carbamoyltransferase HypF [Mariprofundaceae bacterium]
MQATAARMAQRCDGPEVSIPLADDLAPVAALGGDLKNTQCFAADGFARLSPQIGDLEQPDAFRHARDSFERFMHISGVVPRAIACDLHPDYHSTRLAEMLARERSLPLIRVQHHHAHIASVMAEHQIVRPVLGLALDGHGHGADGGAWGGELLLVSGATSGRRGRLAPVAQPGGDVAAREPWRMAVAYFDAVGDEEVAASLFGDEPLLAPVLRLCRQPETGRTSSTGRIFDAAAAVLLDHRRNGFEGEAAMALESAARRAAGDVTPLECRIEADDGLLQLYMTEVVATLANERLRGADVAVLARRFHLTLAAGLAGMAVRQARETGVEDLVLGGGCMVNALLAGELEARLVEAGLRVWRPAQLSPGDGGLSLGQAWVAQRHLAAEGVN